MTTEGRSCVVTGASSGIGRALAVSLAKGGSQVWAVGRNRDRLDALAEQAGEWRGSIAPIIADLEQDEALAAISATVLSESPELDVLIHSAGSMAFGGFTAISPDDFDRQYRVNLRAPVVLTQNLLL